MARKRVIDVTTATRTLSRNENGSLVVLNRAGGITVTLPSAGRGLEFQFAAKADGAYVIDAGTAYIRGSIISAQNNTASKSFVGNGTTHVKIDTNGSTTGGKIGTNFTLTCDTDGIWTVIGALVSSTTAATPLST